MLGHLDQRPVLVASVAGARDADVYATCASFRLRVRPALADAAELKRRQREHDPKDELPGCRGRVEFAVGGQHDTPGFLDALDRLEPADQRPREAVDAGDDHAA